MASFLNVTKRHTSHFSLRNLGWTPLMFDPIDQSRIYQWYQSYSNGSLHGTSSNTSAQRTFYRTSSLHIPEAFSTETAILGFLTDILQAVDEGDVAGLVLLDLSTSFDTVNHSTLLQRLHIRHSVSVYPYVGVVSVVPLRPCADCSSLM